MKLDEKGVEAAEEAFDTWRVDRMKAALSAYFEATQTVPVPREPTTEMCLAGYYAEKEYGRADNFKELARQEVGPTYRAMIEASQED
jgi:hypothetical protein